MATALLCFPLLGGTHQPESLSQLLDRYRERSAADSAVATLNGFSRLTHQDCSIARFLLANDLAELGLADLAATELRALLDFPDLAPAAFVALARLQNETNGAEALVREARRAPWERLGSDDFGEAAFRVARASFSTGRYPEARSWLAQVPKDSSYFPFSRYLLAQTEYALDRYGKAMDAADAIFQVRSGYGSRRWLEDRTAILVGNMLTELGLYPDAIAVLGWPGADSPFHARAERDERLARSLADAEAGAADPERIVDETLAGNERAIEAIATSPERISAQTADLERVWPARALARERRRFAWAAAVEAYERRRGFDWRRPLQVLWYSFPPVIFARIFRGSPEPGSSEDSTVMPDTRFFFTPRGDVTKLLAAVALASEPAHGEGCTDRAARQLRLRAAASLAAAAPLESEELRAIAAGCGGENSPDVVPAVRGKLETALTAEALRLRREIRNQRALFSEALAEARVRRETAVEAAKEGRR